MNVPLYHCFGCVLGSLAMIQRGARLVFPSPTFNAGQSLEAGDRTKNTLATYA